MRSWLLLASSLFLVIYGYVLKDEGHLECAVVIFRHGERAPLFTFTSDEAKAYFKNRIGALTERGRQGMREMGEYFKQKYLIDSPNLQVTAHSVNVQRSFDSMAELLIGMDLNNITIESFKEGGQDWVLAPPWKTCPTMINALKKHCPNLKHLEQYRCYDQLWSDLFVCADEVKSAQHFHSSEDLFLIEAIVSENAANVSTGFADCKVEEAKLLHTAAHQIAEGFGKYKNEKVAKCTAGELMHVIYSELLSEHKVPGLHLLSSQDWILASLLELLHKSEILRDKTPPYRSGLVLEKWKVEGENVVKIWYQQFQDKITTPDRFLLYKINLDTFSKTFEEYKNFDGEAYCLGQ